MFNIWKWPWDWPWDLFMCNSPWANFYVYKHGQRHIIYMQEHNTITHEHTLWKKKKKKKRQVNSEWTLSFNCTSVSMCLPARVSSECSREGQKGNSRPWVQITNSHRRWCSAAVHPKVLYSMHEGICHVNESTNEMERDSSKEKTRLRWQVETCGMKEKQYLGWNIKQHGSTALGHKIIIA